MPVAERPRRMLPALLLAALLLLVGIVAGCCLIGRLGGAFSRRPSEAEDGLSPAARELVDRAVAGIEPGRYVDHHLHAVGLGTGGTGAWVNPAMQSPLHPLRWTRYLVYKSAAGITDLERADRQYVERLVELARGMPVRGRFYLMALDKHHGPDGTPDPERTDFYVPNEYVFSLAGEFPDVLVPVMSVHPDRADALTALVRWASRGGRLVKWLPNAQNIDPADPRYDDFYDQMRELGLVLLSHAGEEQAVEAEEHQELGNPLRLRRALDRGVRVIVAHCASLGEGKDLDDPEGASADSFDLFLRLLFDLVLKRVLRHPETGRAFPASVFMGHPALGL